MLDVAASIEVLRRGGGEVAELVERGARSGPAAPRAAGRARRAAGRAQRGQRAHGRSSTRSRPSSPPRATQLRELSQRIKAGEAELGAARGRGRRSCSWSSRTRRTRRSPTAPARPTTRCVDIWGEKPTLRRSRRGRTGRSARRSASSTSRRRARSRARGSRVLRGAGGAADPRADQLHARSATQHGYDEVWPPALVRRARAARHRPAAQVRGRRRSSTRRRPTPTTICSCRRPPRSRSRTSTATRSSSRAELPHPLHRLLAVLPRRGRQLRQGHARPDPPAPVRQGRAREVRRRPRRATTSSRRCARDAEGVLQRLGLHYRVVTLCTGDLGFAVRQDLRPRGLAAGPGRLSRDLVVLELRGLPGAAREDPLPRRRPATSRARSTPSTARASRSAARSSRSSSSTSRPTARS